MSCWTHLEGIDVSQPVLHVAVHHQLAETQHLSAQMEGVTEPGLLSLLGIRNKESRVRSRLLNTSFVVLESRSTVSVLHLCGQCLHRLQVEVVVQMQVVEVLTVDEQIEHVVALSAHLQTHLHPVQLGGLEELGGLEGAEQIPARAEKPSL